MKDSTANTRSYKKSGVFARFSDYLSACVKNGFFGRLLSSYTERDASAVKHRGFIYTKLICPVRRYVSKRIDASVMMNLFFRLKKLLLACRLRTYGTFFVTFGLYSAAIVFFRHFVLADGTALAEAIVPAVTALAALPLVFAKTTLSNELCNSKLGKNIRAYTGFREEAMTADGSAGRSNIAFALGLALGMLSFLLSPTDILLALATVVFGAAVLASPEVGVVSLFFLLPWVSTVSAVKLTLLIGFSLLVKVIRGKRTLRFGRVDAAVLLFGVLMLLGGLIPGASDARASAVVYFVFILGYLIAVSVLKTEKWIERAVLSLIASSALMCAYVVLGYAIPLLKDVSFVDYSALSSFFDIAGNMFGDAKMLSDCFVLIFPVVFGMLLSGNAGQRYKFACFLISVVTVIYTALDFSIGSAVALAVSFMMILLVRNHHFIYLFILVSCALPAAWLMFPSFFSDLFRAVIPESAFETVEYVGQVWNGTIAMLEDHFLTGIGLGASSWKAYFSQYALGTVSLAPHSHSLYLQILSTLGFFGLASFAVAVMYVFRSVFSYLCRMSAKRGEYRERSDSSKAEKNIYRSYISSKLFAAAPMVSVAAALILGISDNIWYNYRLFFMFWLISALAVSCTRCTDGWLNSDRALDDMSGVTEAELTIYLNR